MCLISAPDSPGREPSPRDKGAIVEGAGFTLYDMESIKGSDAGSGGTRSGLRSVETSQDPQSGTGRSQARPKVTIKGENFGTKECFHGVAFSAAGPAKIEHKFVNDTTIEATVPDVKAGCPSSMS